MLMLWGGSEEQASAGEGRLVRAQSHATNNAIEQDCGVIKGELCAVYFQGISIDV